MGTRSVLKRYEQEPCRHYERGEAEMNQHGPSLLEGIEEMRQRMSEVLSRLLPEDLTARAAPQLDEVISSVLEKFQLVPREEFEQYLALLNKLQAEVENLTQRLSELEAPARRSESHAESDHEHPHA